MIDRHNHPDGCVLTLTLPGVSEHDIDRGIAVAQTFFDFEDVHPYAAYTALKVFTANDPDFPLSEEESRWAALWSTGQVLAIVAGWGMGSAWPQEAVLGLHWGGMEVVTDVEEYRARVAAEKGKRKS